MMRNFKVFLIAVMTMLSSAVVSYSQDAAIRRVESALVDAVALYDKGDVKNAAKILGDILKTCPDNDAAHEYLGLCHYAMKDDEYAEMHLAKAAELDPGNYWYRYRLAQFYMFSGNFAMAEKYYSKLLEDFPKKDGLYFDMIDIYVRQNKPDEALGVLENIETVLGKNESTARMRASILNSMGDQRGAMESLEKFNEEYSSPWVLTVLGDYNMSMYNDSTALICYQEALDIEDNYPPAVLGKAEVYRIMKKYDDFFTLMKSFIGNKGVGIEGKSDYLQAIVKNTDPRFIKGYRDQLDSLYDLCVNVHPTDSLANLTAGMYYYATERKSKAKEYFRRNMELYPENIASVGTYLQMLSYNEDWEDLSQKALEASEKFPEELTFLEFASVAKYYMKDYLGVLEVSDMMLKKAPGDSAVVVSAYTTKGDIYHLLGETKKAYKAYDKVLKLAPDYAPVLNNYAFYLSEERKNLKKAEAMSLKTIQAEPDNHTYLDTYAWILFLQGRAAEAKPHFKHAMLYGGKENAIELDHYAEVLYALGEYDLSFAYWMQAKKKDVNHEIPGLEEKIEARKAAIKK